MAFETRPRHNQQFNRAFSPPTSPCALERGAPDIFSTFTLWHAMATMKSTKEEGDNENMKNQPSIEALQELDHSNFDVEMVGSSTSSVTAPAGNDSPTSPSQPSSPFLISNPPSLLREILIVAVILFAQLLARAGLSQSIAPITYIGETFHNTSPSVTLWFPSAFSLTAGTLILVAGRIGDIIGHRNLFLFGLVWYTLWSTLAGLAAVPRNPSLIFFDICRAMQGVSAAILTPTGLAILGSMYKPGPRKAKVFAIFGAAAPNGVILGALFSALLAEKAWWPWAYWVLAIVCLALGIVSWWALPDYQNLGQKQAINGEKIQEKRFDWWGSLTGVAGLTLFNVAWNQASSEGWKKPYIIVLLVLGVLLIAAFIMVERRASQPLVAVGSMSPEALYVVGCVALGWASFGIWVYYVWEFLMRLRRLSPLTVTAQILPGSASGLFAALMTGFLLSRVRKATIMIFAMVAFCLGNIIAATMPVEQLYWKQTFWSVLIIPFGMDLSFPTATLLMSNLVPVSHQGVAASTIAATVNYSISLGLGIAGTVESQVRDGDLLKGFRGGWYTAIGMSGCGVIIAIVHGVVDLLKSRRAQEERRRNNENRVDSG
jgi:MFS family permease